MMYRLQVELCMVCKADFAGLQHCPGRHGLGQLAGRKTRVGAATKGLTGRQRSPGSLCAQGAVSACLQAIDALKDREVVERDRHRLDLDVVAVRDEHLRACSTVRDSSATPASAVAGLCEPGTSDDFRPTACMHVPLHTGPRYARIGLRHRAHCHRW